MFSGKKRCRKSLTAGSPSCLSNVNCKLNATARPWSRDILRFADFQEKPDAKGTYYVSHLPLCILGVI